MIDEVRFWDRHRAEAHTFTSQDWVISITSPGSPEANIRGAGKILRLAFSDVVEPIRISDDVTLMPMTEADAQSIIDTVTSWESNREKGIITVHCDAGASRSAAVAVYVFAYSWCYFPTAEFAKEANTYMMDLFDKLTSVQVRCSHAAIATQGGLA